MKLTLLSWSAAWLSVSYTAAFQPSPLQKGANSIQTGTLQYENLKFSSSSRPSASKLFMSSAAPSDPQVLSSGYSQQMKLQDAIQEAMAMAIQEGLPDGSKNIDLAIVSVSSLYDGSASPSEVVPAFLSASQELGYEIQNLVGSSSGGFVSSRPNPACAMNDSTDDEEMIRSCLPIEQEGVPGVSVTLCILPDVQVQVRMDLVVKFICFMFCFHNVFLTTRAQQFFVNRVSMYWATTFQMTMVESIQKFGSDSLDLVGLNQPHTPYLKVRIMMAKTQMLLFSFFHPPPFKTTWIHFFEDWKQSIHPLKSLVRLRLLSPPCLELVSFDTKPAIQMAFKL